MTKTVLLITCLSTLVGCAGAAPKPAPVTRAPQQAASGPSSVDPQLKALAEQPVVVGGGFFASMPRGLTSFGGAVVDGSFYLVGGYSGEPHRYTAEGQSAEIWKLPLSTPTQWSRLTRMRLHPAG